MLACFAFAFSSWLLAQPRQDRVALTGCLGPQGPHQVFLGVLLKEQLRDEASWDEERRKYYTR
jgi:hypothetical protein